VAVAVEAAVGGDPHRTVDLEEAEDGAAATQPVDVELLHAVAAQHAHALDGADPQAVGGAVQRGDQPGRQALGGRHVHAAGIDPHHSALGADPHALAVVVGGHHPHVATGQAVAAVVQADAAVAADPENAV